MKPVDVETLNGEMAVYRARVESALSARIGSADDGRNRLYRALRYGVLNGGKRVRAILVYAAGNALGAPQEILDIPAVAVELIHAYSLIHDDLPAMDDDDFRRGQPTCHRAFDEATALLAGDALQCLAFEVLSGTEGLKGPEMASPAMRLDWIRILSEASGALGMAGGQGIDLDSVGKQISLEALERMHRFKTGALIRAAVRLGACSAGTPEPHLQSGLDEYAACIGLAVQIRDDGLDIIGDTAVTGKDQGSDAEKDKPTYPALIGLEAAEKRAADLHERALEALAPLGDEARTLRLLSEFIVHRAH